MSNEFIIYEYKNIKNEVQDGYKRHIEKGYKPPLSLYEYLSEKGDLTVGNVITTCTETGCKKEHYFYHRSLRGAPTITSLLNLKSCIQLYKQPYYGYALTTGEVLSEKRLKELIDKYG